MPTLAGSLCQLWTRQPNICLICLFSSNFPFSLLLTKCSWKPITSRRLLITGTRFQCQTSPRGTYCGNNSTETGFFTSTSILRESLSLHHCFLHLSGAFAKLRKATIIIFMSLLQPIRLHGKLGFHWKDLDEILYLRFFRKSVEKGQFSLKSDKKNGHFTSRIVYASVMVSRLFFPKIKQFSDESYIENLNTNFMLTTIFVKIVSFMR